MHNSHPAEVVEKWTRGKLSLSRTGGGEEEGDQFGRWIQTKCDGLFSTVHPFAKQWQLFMAVVLRPAHEWMPLTGSLSLRLLDFTFKMGVVLIADYLLMVSSKQRLIIYTLALLNHQKHFSYTYCFGQTEVWTVTFYSRRPLKMWEYGNIL